MLSLSKSLPRGGKPWTVDPWEADVNGASSSSTAALFPLGRIQDKVTVQGAGNTEIILKTIEKGSDR